MTHQQMHIHQNFPRVGWRVCKACLFLNKLTSLFQHPPRVSVIDSMPTCLCPKREQHRTLLHLSLFFFFSLKHPLWANQPEFLIVYFTGFSGVYGIPLDLTTTYLQLLSQHNTNNTNAFNTCDVQSFLLIYPLYHYYVFNVCTCHLIHGPIL